MEKIRQIRRMTLVLATAIVMGMGAFATVPHAHAQSSASKAELKTAHNKGPKSELPNIYRPDKPQPPVGSWVKTSSATIANVPSRTSMAVVTPVGIAKTPNADEARPGLSIVKIYIADYALTFGDKSGTDRYLAQRMVRLSDNDAAAKLSKKYPRALSSTAKRYGLSNTQVGEEWGLSWTSATDAAIFLNKLRAKNPDSPVLYWMQTAAPVAADGTEQKWGTAHLPGVIGTKWGWSDHGKTTVGSASYGAGYTAAAFTWGAPSTQTKDVLKARPSLG